MVTERDTPARQCTRTPFSLLRASSVGRTQEMKPTKINKENHIICTLSYSTQYYKDSHNLNTDTNMTSICQILPSLNIKGGLYTDIQLCNNLTSTIVSSYHSLPLRY